MLALQLRNYRRTTAVHVGLMLLDFADFLLSLPVKEFGESVNILFNYDKKVAVFF